MRWSSGRNGWFHLHRNDVRLGAIKAVSQWGGCWNWDRGRLVVHRRRVICHPVIILGIGCQRGGVEPLGEHHRSVERDVLGKLEQLFEVLDLLDKGI